MENFSGMEMIGVLLLVTTLLILLGFKSASRIAGTGINFFIVLCLGVLSTISMMFFFPGISHSATMLTLWAISAVATLLSVGVTAHLAKKIIWK